MKTKKTKICIIQLTRLGDLIQTVQAISNFDNHDNLEFHLIGRSTFTEPLKYKLSKCFKNIFLIDINKIFSHKSLSKSQEYIKNTSNEINKENFDLVINLTFSKTSAYLSSLIKSKARTGLYYNNENNLVIDDQMSRYFYTNVNDSIYNSIHIIDLFKQIIGLNSKPSKQFKHLTNKDPEITIHPFSSKAKKQWNERKWTEVIFKLLKNTKDLKINLIGSKNERKESKNILSSPILNNFKNRIKNYTGKLSLEETEQIIKKSSLLLSHDSVNSHIAAQNGIKSIIVSLGSSRIYETAPYLENCYILSSNTSCFPCHVNTACDDYICHSSISYQVLVEITEIVLKDGELDQKNINNINLFTKTNLILHKTLFKNNFLVLEPIINHSKDENIRRILNTTWQYYLNETELKLNIIKNNETLSLSKYLNHINYIFELTQFGKKYSEYIIRELACDQPKIDRIKEYSNKIDNIEELFVQLSPTCPELSPFLNYFKYERANLKGINLVDLSEESYLSFQSMEIFSKILYELINSVINSSNNRKHLSENNL